MSNEVLVSMFNKDHYEARASLDYDLFWYSLDHAFDGDLNYLDIVVVPFELLTSQHIVNRHSDIYHYFSQKYNNVDYIYPDYNTINDLLKYANRDFYASFIVDPYLDSYKLFKGSKDECVKIMQAYKNLVIFNKQDFYRTIKGYTNIKSFYNNDLFYEIMKFYSAILRDCYYDYIPLTISYIDLNGESFDGDVISYGDFNEQDFLAEIAKKGYKYTANDFIARTTYTLK